MMIHTDKSKWLGSAIAALCLAACGGGEIGGTLSGLGSGLSVTLRNNEADPLTLTKNGSFTFANSLPVSSRYAVTVLTQPVGQRCDVANASGVLNADGDSINNVTVVCTTTGSLVGSLSGLVAGTAVSLANAGVELPLVADGPFAFPGLLSDGAAYNVTVLRQPLSATCTVSNGTGTFLATAATKLSVACN